MERTVTGVGVLDKAMALVDAVEATPRTLSELTQATGLSRATAHRLAAALERHGLLAREPGGRWTVGHRMAGTSLVAAARPALERLRDATGESVQLYLPRGAVRVCALSLESPHGLRTIVPVGASLPMTAGSAARVLGGDPAALARGWAESVEEREAGVASVSAPVLHGGQPLAAVSVSGPVGRTTRQPGRRYAGAVVTAARHVEEAAGLRP